MCGIAGYIGESSGSVEVMDDALTFNAPRGYHSWGVMQVNLVGETRIVKELGGYLDRSQDIGVGAVMIAHNRWASVGSKDNHDNAHPFSVNIGIDRSLVGVMNGTIRNYKEMLDDVDPSIAEQIEGETDTEILISAIASKMQQENLTALEAASIVAREQAVGEFALVLFDTDSQEEIVCLKKGKKNPILLAETEGATLLSSIVDPFVGRSDTMTELVDSSAAVLTPNGFEAFDFDGNKLQVTESVVPDIDVTAYELDGHADYYVKEIVGQGETSQRTLDSLVNGTEIKIDLPISLEQAVELEEVSFIATGSSLHAAWLGIRMLEQVDGLDLPHMQVDLPKDYSLRHHVPKKSMAVGVSQSGTTADVIGMIDQISEGIPKVAIVNVEGSDLERMCDYAVHINSGREIAVASTKAFTSQVISIVLMGLELARMRDSEEEAIEGLIRDLQTLRESIDEVLELKQTVFDEVENLFEQIVDQQLERALDDQGYDQPYRENAKAGLSLAMSGISKDWVTANIIGEGPNQAVGYEVALKSIEVGRMVMLNMKAELMKHGYIALAENPSVLIALLDGDEKNDAEVLKACDEYAAQNGQIFAIGPGANSVESSSWRIEIPDYGFCSPILVNIVGQLISLKIGYMKGLNVAFPEHLAKTVTV